MPRRTSCSFVTLTPVLAAAILAACTSGITGSPALVSLLLFSGSGQSGPIGSTLPQPLIVRVEDQVGGQPVAGVVVNWQVTAGGGSVDPAQSVTDGSGQAGTTWRLGGTLGAGTVTARLGSATVVFSSTAITAPVAILVAASGNAQVATVGTQLAQPIVVRATDAAGNPKAGVLVSFSVVTAGGTLSAPSSVTDAAGLASVRWTLGPTAGIQTMIASTSGLAPLNLTASATAGAPTAIALDFGNNQSGTPGAPLPDSLRVRVSDGFGNPVSGVSINWAALSGSGTVSPAVSISSASGRAATRWTLGSTGGAKYVVATLGGGALSVTFTGGGNVLYSSIGSGGGSTCGITIDAAMLCWGNHAEGQLGIGQPAGGSGPVFASPQSAATGGLTFRQVVASLQHACAVTLSNVGYCWGLNVDGRLGTNSLTSQNVPTPVFTAVAFQMPAAGRTHSCALSLAARVLCWGASGTGQTGIGAAGGSVLVPTEVSGGLSYQAVAAGGQHSCAILAGAGGGAGYCWGANASGQLGDATTTTRFVPTPVAGGLSFAAITTGNAHSCGLNAAGVAYCWGSNADGQLGTGASSATPVPVAGGLIFASVSAGQTHTCAVTAVGALYCWGNNTKGQLGDGTTTNRTTPVLVSGGLAFQSVSAGDLHTCAVTLTNLSYCWGDNQFGQLGDGTLVNRPVPTRVAYQP